jgi:hypothetical protein
MLSVGLFADFVFIAPLYGPVAAPVYMHEVNRGGKYTDNRVYRTERIAVHAFGLGFLAVYRNTPNTPV